MYRLILILTVAFLNIPRRAFACAVCFGGNDAAARVGIPLAVLTLLGILLCVMGGFIAFFINLQKRTKLAISAH